MKYQAVIFDYRGTLGFKEIPEYVQILIRDLYHSGYLLGVISNSDRYGDARWLRQKLVEHNIFEYFQCVVGSSALESGETWVSGGVHKADPRIFRRVLNLMGLEAEEAVYVGDSFKHDILGAGTIGMGTLYVNVDKASYNEELWELLEDGPECSRPNRLTSFRLTDENLPILTFDCLLRSLTEPLDKGQRIVMGKREYQITGFSPSHTKDEIIHGKSDAIVVMSVEPLDEYEMNKFSGLDLNG